MSRKVAVLLSLLFTFSSFHAYAEVDYCNDPVGFVCDGSETYREARKAELKRIKEEIRVEAAENAVPRIEELKKRRRSERGFMGFLSRLTSWTDEYKIKQQEIMNSAKSRISGFEEDLISDETVALIKRLLKQAIDESTFPQDVKDKFKTKVDVTVVGTFADYLKKSGSDSSFLAQMFGNHCGSDGLVTNAFATQLGGGPYVLICPGWLISVNTMKTEFEKISVVLQVLTHELAHHIDARDYSNDYTVFSKCYADNLAHLMNKTDKDQAFCEQHPEKCNDKVIESHSGEIVADHWAAKVMALYLKENQIEPATSQTIISGSMMKLCGSRDQGIHPKGEFRISHIMGMDAGIRESLQCSEPQESHPVCDFDGLVSQD